MGGHVQAQQLMSSTVRRPTGEELEKASGNGCRRNRNVSDLEGSRVLVVGVGNRSGRGCRPAPTERLAAV
jgi:hypothetical protein